MKSMDNFQPTKNYSHDNLKNTNPLWEQNKFFFLVSVQVRDEKLRADLIH